MVGVHCPRVDTAVSFLNRKPHETPQTPPPEDRVLLRDAVVGLLQPFKRQATGPQHLRIRRLEERLRRFPAPTGLLGQVERIAEDVRLGGSAPAREKQDVDLMPLMATLAKGLAAVALVDQRLEVAIERYIKGQPRNASANDVRRLQGQIDDIARLGQMVRKQTILEREEMARMLTDMADALQAAGAQSETMTAQIDSLARTLVSTPMPEQLADTRRKMLSELKGMYAQTKELRSGLEAAKKRSKELEEIVSKTTKALHEARQQAATDPLTGLANRGAFDRALAEGMTSARRLHRPLALVLIDIDKFKSVNDTWGHPVGDIVLKAVSEAMRHELRDQDTVARFGGEEFALLLEGAPEGIAFTVADRIRQRVAAQSIPIPPEESADNQPFEVSITLSAGVSVLQDDETAENLVKRTDKALYAAKHGGRNQVVIGQ
jgi:diguanylate cyclase